MNKKVKTEDVETYIIEEPTEKSQVLLRAITDGIVQAGVQSDEVLPVLGEAVIRFLTCVAEVSGIEPLSLIKSFGEGIYTAELEFHEKGGRDDGNTSH